MAHLSLSFLGPFQAKLDDQPLREFKSNKVRALLVYLAIESDRPHPREALAGLLWPDWPDRDAMSNLRYALADLRRTIGDRDATPSFLLISRESIQFNKDSDYWLDVDTFANSTVLKKKLELGVEQLEQSINLYQGDFLEGFTLGDSPPFEEWTLLTRERLARQASSALRILTESCEVRGDYEKSQSYAWKQLELESWDETAHRSLMRTLAMTGQRNAALAQYESCRKLLAEGLDVEPSEETKNLFEKIRVGEFKAYAKPQSTISRQIIRTPAFLTEEVSTFEPPAFAARVREMEKLNNHLLDVLDGKGKVIFVTGETGSGKTALIQEFTRRAQEIYPNLLVANGDCNAYTGTGDPHQPFREILEFLTGDVESRWAVGAITREHALRLWQNVPIVAKALVEVGPDLIDTFIQRTALLERARTSVTEKQEWLIRLGELLDRKSVTVLSIGAMQQINLFEQYTRVLHALEVQSPVLLVLDDLQWADTGSINLLFHLGRCIAGHRILILGAYRSEDIALGREGMRHPLETLVNEFRRTFGDILINLGQSLSQEESREFVDEVLDKEPNHFGESFREMLHKQTQGHPLFTIELLRGMQERGDILKDSDGFWVTGQSLDWETLPVRVEAVIQERIGRLPETMQRVLEIASVEGEFFAAEIVARVLGGDERELLEYLSGELDRKHRLIRAQSVQRVNDCLVSRYQFRHILTQKYLYGTLDKVERVHLHEQIGRVLEDLFGASENVATVAVQLALHFREAQIAEKAIQYLFLAGNQAINLSAYQEAVTHITRGLELLSTLPVSQSRNEQELNMNIALGIAWQGAGGGQFPKVKDAYFRARDLCQKLNKPAELAQVLGGLSIFYYVHAEHHKAIEHALEGLDLAESVQDQYLMLLCRWYLGFINFCLGEYQTALSYLEQVTDFYDSEKHHQILVQMRGSDAGLGAMAYKACCLWCLGYPEQALQCSQEALTLARKLAHPFTLADVICFAGCQFHSMRRDASGLALEADSLFQLAQEASLEGWKATAQRYLGEALVLQGKIGESAQKIKKGLSALKSEEIGLYFSGTLATLAEGCINALSGNLATFAEGCMDAGHFEEVRSSLDEAFAFVEKTDERYWESELFRLKGEMLIRDGDIAGAEACFHKAIDISQKQSAKSLELRAATSLSRLWKKQGKSAQARKLLAEVYDWFIEGFETPDLLEAKALLDELS